MTRHSLHIGINHYEDPDICDLPFCMADVHLLTSFFKDVVGYESVSVLENPTRTEILDAVMSEAGRLSPGDLLVLTYSGHGFRSEGKSLLGATDSRIRFVQDGVDGVPVSTLKRAIGDAGCDCAFFIDACPAEGMGTRNISVQKSSRELNISNVSIAKAQGFQVPSFALMSPETSIEATSLENGLFTAALARALREAHEEGLPMVDDILRRRVLEQAKAICQDTATSFCPDIQMSLSGCPVRLW